MRRSALGIVEALVALAVFTCAMLPFRSHLSVAMTALVLVVPVVIGVVAGGSWAGLVSVVTGFVVFVYFFVPPYLTASVGAPQNWVALGVYIAITLPVAIVVDRLHVTRRNERRRSQEIRELFELSELLVADRPLDTLLSAVVTSLSTTFGYLQVAILLDGDDGPAVVASTGPAVTAAQLDAAAGLRTTAVTPTPHPGLGVTVLPLAASGRPIGMLVLSTPTAPEHDREALLLFANQIALAVERVQLRESSIQARLAEQVDLLAKTLVAAVSHDLRTPLASIKASSSILSDETIEVAPARRRELATLIDIQADRLASLVADLLDMSRIQAGVLTPHRLGLDLADLVHSVLADLEPATHDHPVQVGLPEGLPPVDVDPLLIERVLTNLLVNAVRHAPRGTPVTISAEQIDPDTVELSITDCGPGIAPERRDDIFNLHARRQGDSGAGLGLTIARTFVEAHGQRLWVEDGPGGGARFRCTLATWTPAREEGIVVADSGHR